MKEAEEQAFCSKEGWGKTTKQEEMERCFEWEAVAQVWNTEGPSAAEKASDQILLGFSREPDQ